MKLDKEIHEDLVTQKSLCIFHIPSNHVLTYFSWVSEDDKFDSKRRLAWGIVFQKEETEKACDLIKNLWMFSKMRIEDSGLHSTGDPSSTGICFKIPSGCLKPQIVLDPIYTTFFPIHTFLR